MSGGPELGDAIVIVDADAETVGREVRAVGAAEPRRRVIGFVGADDDPARSEMVAELLGGERAGENAEDLT